jgi:hypothetical protein
MTNQELDLYLDPILQAHFEMVKGEWWIGDVIKYQHPFEEDYGELGLVTNVHERNPGHQLIGTYFTTSEGTLFIEDGDTTPNCIKWIPRPIDIDNPERGLWGMVDWQRASIHRDRDNVGVGWTILTWRTPSDVVFNNADTPTAALLMALKEQLK